MSNIKKINQKGEVLGVIFIIGSVLALVGTLLFATEILAIVKGETFNEDLLRIGVILIFIGLILSRFKS